MRHTSLELSCISVKLAVSRHLATVLQDWWPFSVLCESRSPSHATSPPSGFAWCGITFSNIVPLHSSVICRVILKWDIVTSWEGTVKEWLQVANVSITAPRGGAGQEVMVTFTLILHWFLHGSCHGYLCSIVLFSTGILHYQWRCHSRVCGTLEWHLHWCSRTVIQQPSTTGLFKLIFTLNCLFIDPSRHTWEKKIHELRGVKLLNVFPPNLSNFPPSLNPWTCKFKITSKLSSS